MQKRTLQIRRLCPIHSNQMRQHERICKDRPLPIYWCGKCDEWWAYRKAFGRGMMEPAYRRHV